MAKSLEIRVEVMANMFGQRAEGMLQRYASFGIQKINEEMRSFQGKKSH